MLWSKFDLLLERHKYPLPLAPTNVGSYGGENCCPVATRFMGSLLYRCFRRISIYALVQPSSRAPFLRSIVSNPVLSPSMSLDSCCQLNSSWLFRNLSYGSVNLVISQGNPKFETHKVDPPKREKWKTKKRLKLQRKREKQKRKAANKRDPRWLGVKGKKKQKFANPEDRIKCKLEKAKVKEALLIERLKRYEISKLQVALPKPDDLTGEERFYLKKMAQKGSNYVPVGRRGIFGGVILNMHMHWKKHETVKVICKPCKPGQLQEYAREISRLSGGTAIQTFGDNTIIFYRGKNYVQPEVMSPVDTLSKKRALEKSKYEQSLESVRRFIAIAEKELELYYRHVALYGDPNNRNPLSVLDESRRETMKSLENPEIEETLTSTSDIHCSLLSDMKLGFTDQDLSETEDDSANGGLSTSELDCDTNSLSGHDLDTDDEEECEPDTKSSSQSYHNLHLDDGCKFDSELNDWSGPDEELELTSFCNQRSSVTAEDFTTLTQHRNLSR